MRKKEIVTLCLVVVIGLSMGFFVRYLSLNGFHADTVEQSGFIVAHGTVTKEADGYSLANASVMSGQAIIPVAKLVIISNSPSIDFATFANKDVRVEGKSQEGVLAVMSIYSL